VVKVQDEGVGIAPEALPHITDPFFTTKSDSGGIGLGLSISSRIIKEHGGTLTFTSEPGRGTTAEIILPVLGTYHDSKGAVE
jgi:polar amino acid transport system substrate-binding protein